MLWTAAERQFVRMDYQETVAAIFRNHPDVDGILCSNDVIAAEIIQYCRAAGDRHSPAGLS